MQYISGEARKPSIFVSSTCYDLKQIRQDIREFIEADLGYDIVAQLSRQKSKIFIMNWYGW